MKNAPLPKALRQQAKLRKVKTPDVLAQQAALNAVMLGRKGGAHKKPNTRKSLLAAFKASELLSDN